MKRDEAIFPDVQGRVPSMLRCIARSAPLVCGLLVYSALAVSEVESQVTELGDDEELLTLDVELGQTVGDEFGGYEARGFWESMTDNLRLDVDFVSRIETTRRRGAPSGLNAMGLDIHKVITTREGDVGTLLLQPYLVRRDNALPVPLHIEDDDDWEFEFHDFYFNWTQFGRGRFNVKVGHFDVPYGLEPNVDTHFTVYQLIPFQNIGMKKDWGVSVNGALPSLDYEFSVSLGSGMELENAGKNFAVSGRVGTHSDENFVVGASFFYGQVIDPHRLHRWRLGLRHRTRVDRSLGRRPGDGRGDDDLVRRFRSGLDLTWIVGQFTFRGEASAGWDYDQDVVNSLIEANWTSADERVKAYLQVIYLGQRGSRSWDEDVIARIGASWEIDERWTVSGRYSQILERYADRQNDSQFTLQARLRF